MTCEGSSASMRPLLAYGRFACRGVLGEHYEDDETKGDTGPTHGAKLSFPFGDLSGCRFRGSIDFICDRSHDLSMNCRAKGRPQTQHANGIRRRLHDAAAAQCS